MNASNGCRNRLLENGVVAIVDEAKPGTASR